MTRPELHGAKHPVVTDQPTLFVLPADALTSAPPAPAPLDLDALEQHVARLAADRRPLAATTAAAMFAPLVARIRELEADLAATLSDADRNTLGKFGRGAPATSRLAALAVYPRTGTQRARILDVIASRYEAGVTDDEGEQLLGMLHTSYTARRGELVTGGWLRDTGRRRRTRSGNDATVWTLTLAAQRRPPTA